MGLVYDWVPTKIIEPIKATCDWCGKEQDLKKNEWGYMEVNFGYGSDHDGRYRACICDKCFEKNKEKFEDVL